VVPRVSPHSTPRAPSSQYGAPSPANAGTRYTPPVSATVSAMAATVVADCPPPRNCPNQSTAPPVTVMLPSSAYDRWPASAHATVVDRPRADRVDAPTRVMSDEPVP